MPGLRYWLQQMLDQYEMTQSVQQVLLSSCCDMYKWGMTLWLWQFGLSTGDYCGSQHGLRAETPFLSIAYLAMLQSQLRSPLRSSKYIHRIYYLRNNLRVQMSLGQPLMHFSCICWTSQMQLDREVQTHRQAYRAECKVFLKLTHRKEKFLSKCTIPQSMFRVHNSICIGKHSFSSASQLWLARNVTWKTCSAIYQIDKYLSK